MTARLPSVGGDSGAWGDLLNAWLLVGHDSGGNNLSSVQSNAVTLTAQAYTTTNSDLGKMLLVSPGSSNAIITLLSAVTAGDGAMHYITKADGAAGRVVVSDGADQAWLSVQNDIVAFRSNGASWSAVGWQIKPLKQVFTSSGTWTKPPLAFSVDVLLFGPGGAGGSGSRRAISGIRTGGSGGAGGAIVKSLPAFQASLLGSTETVTVPGGPAGGLAVTVDTTNGNPGSTGSNTTFGGWLVAVAGSAGSGGGTLGATAAGSQLTQSNVGIPNASVASSSTTSAPAIALPAQCGAGSPGAGATAANVLAPGLAGSAGSCYSGTQTTGGTIGTAGNDGGPGGSITDTTMQTGGAGGGGGFWVTSTAGTNGGAGGAPGGGGGGGAASDNGFNSGAGGTGGRGEARITSYFA